MKFIKFKMFEILITFTGQFIEREDEFTRCLTEKLMTYALGRELDLRDRSTIDGIVGELDERGGGLADLVEAIVVSDTFGRN